MTIEQQLELDRRLFGFCVYTEENGLKKRIDPTKIIINYANRKKALGKKNKYPWFPMIALFILILFILIISTLALIKI